MIVLVHGFGALRFVMWPLTYRLRACGFRVKPWNYSSLFATIDHHARALNDYLATDLADEARIHIVAHSMGAIVTRAALSRSRIQNLGRVVMLAPPNTGSPVARIASKFVGRLITPTRELSDVETSFVNQMRDTAYVPIGIIAARYDLLVPIKNTHLQGERMHIALNATHNSLLLSRTVCRACVSFLRA